MNYNKLMEVLMLFAVFVIGISVGLGVYLYQNGVFTSTSLESEDQSKNCQNMTLQETAWCLRDRQIPFYNYTVRSDLYRSEEEIRANGGDCYDYSNLYVKWAEDLGFEAKTVSFFPDSGAGHQMALIWDNNLTGYCILDQTMRPRCNELGNADDYTPKNNTSQERFKIRITNDNVEVIK